MTAQDKKFLFVGLVAAAVGGFMWYQKQHAAANVPVTDPGSLLTDIDGTPIPDPTKVITNNPITYNNNIPVFTTTPTTATSAASTTQGKQYYNSLLGVFSDPVYRAAFAKMNDNELYYAWWYWANYLAHQIPLLRETKVLSNGQWDNSNPGNAQLYDAIIAIHKKYGIF